MYDAAHRLLLAVNAGSNAVTSFTVDGDHLRNRRVVGSGGAFPSSIAVSGEVASVLDAGGDGAIPMALGWVQPSIRPPEVWAAGSAGSHRSMHP